MSDAIQENAAHLTPDEMIRKFADEAGFGEEILTLDLVAGCGVTSPVHGKLWHVLEPASGRAFVFCTADKISLGDVEALGLDPETPFLCYETALDEETRAFIVEQGVLILSNPAKLLWCGYYLPSAQIIDVHSKNADVLLDQEILFPFFLKHFHLI